MTDPARLNRISSTYHHIMVTREANRLPGDAVLAYPHQPYSFAWYTWGQPVIVLPPEGPDNDVPTQGIARGRTQQTPPHVLHPAETQHDRRTAAARALASTSRSCRMRGTVTRLS